MIADYLSFSNYRKSLGKGEIGQKETRALAKLMGKEAFP